MSKARTKGKIINLNKRYFLKSPTNSFDYAILEKCSDINCIVLKSSMDRSWKLEGNFKSI